VRDAVVVRGGGCEKCVGCNGWVKYRDCNGGRGCAYLLAL
jgi:hypothetical protein